MAVITISKEFASGGLEIARNLAEKLGYDYFDKEIVKEIAERARVSHQEASDFEEEAHVNFRAYLSRIIDLDIFKKGKPDDSEPEVETSYDERDKIPYSFDTQGWIDSDIYREMICKVISELSQRSNVIIVGRGGQCILNNQPGVINIRIIALMNDRIARLQVDNPDLSESEARKLIEEMDKRSREYIKFYFNADWDDPKLYDVVVNTSRLSDGRVLDCLAALCQ
ncbi:MAG: cytidylate kinase-like family protein [Deltaproteobacteria bacterium]|nr:cytidylate kinase-like family protein [Deltaproteobacteria bacterium]